MARIETLRRSGKLQVNAGRIQQVIAREHQLQVSWHPRGSHVTSTLTVDLVVNALGPNYAIERSTDPLLVSLRKAGLVSSDALNLGIRTGSFGACLDAQGRASQHLYYLGPMLRADHLDATAAVELRDHADVLGRNREHVRQARARGEARIGFHVTNARGEGVQAALGLQVVDQAVFALAEKQPGFAKVFFYLEQEAMKPRYEIHSIGLPEAMHGSAHQQFLTALRSLNQGAVQFCSKNARRDGVYVYAVGRQLDGESLS